MVTEWIRRYYPEDQVPAVLAVLAAYGTEPWHQEAERVKRNVVIVSRGSIEILKSAVRLALEDYRDILIGEQVDPWVIAELGKYSAESSSAKGATP